MDRDGTKELDKAVAFMLVSPSSDTVLRVVREARALRGLALSEGNERVNGVLDGLYRDALSLHDSIVTLESDPEIVKRNMLARIITAVFPVINGLEGFRNFERKTLWDLFMSTLSIAAEISTATQYLESANLAAKAHFERDLLRLESRILELMPRGGVDPVLTRTAIEDYFDSLRKTDIPTTQMPVVAFVLWLLVLTASYKLAKAGI